MTKIDHVVEAVRADLLRRSQLGIVKYGTTLFENPGQLRYWLNHTYEEVLDAANYLKSAMMFMDGDMAANRKDPVLDAVTLERAVIIEYVNYRGEHKTYAILPQRWWFGSVEEYHPETQWLLSAFDIERKVWRDFAMNNIKAWNHPESRVEKKGE